MKVVSGSSNPLLAQKICEHLGVTLVPRFIRRFADGEIYVEIQENIRGQDVFIIQSTAAPANDNIMELLIMMDALRRGSVGSINLVIPYFGYARQDRKTAPRSPITSKLVANLISSTWADRVITIDLHASQIQGFFDIPVDNLYALPLFKMDILSRSGDNSNLAIIAPDVGGMLRVRALAKKLDRGIGVIDKRREQPGESEVMNVIGDVKGKECILLDDIVDSAGTLCNAAQALMDQGASSVSAYCTHGVLTGKALPRIEASPLKELVITDSIAVRETVALCPKIRTLTVAPFLAEIIVRVTNRMSVSSLFE